MKNWFDMTDTEKLAIYFDYLMSVDEEDALTYEEFDDFQGFIWAMAEDAAEALKEAAEGL